MHHVRAGNGEPLVLIHGLGGSAAIWEPVLGLLAPHRDVIAVDLPGFGASPPLDGDGTHSAAGLARELASHLATLGVERPHAAGNSLGAWVALELAADGRAASVCGISPAGLWLNALGPRAYDARPLARRLRTALKRALRTEAGRRRILATTAARPERLSAAEAARWFDAWLDAPGYDDANEQMRAGAFERAADVRVPCTMAWGAEDRLLRAPRRERLPAHARILTVPGWGHTPTYDDPEGVARLLLEASSAGGDARW